MSERRPEAVSLSESHHPEVERLALHAAGQLRPVERVILEAHLAFCASCTALLRGLLDPGARWLGTLSRVPLPDALWERLDSSLDSPEAAGIGRVKDARASTALSAGARALRPSAVPMAAWEELRDLAPALRWRPVPTSRARYALLATDPIADAQLVLVELVGGARFPAHQHLGPEEMVILAGGYTDAVGHFEQGAYHRYAPGTEHSALSDAGETCWALGLIERGLRFRGLLGVLQWLTDPRARRGVLPATLAD
jgi:putative transcriptional regulator